MTIDGAIAHAREVAKRRMAEYENHYDKDAHYYPTQCKKCAEEHIQLAEWLEELKSYRVSVFSGDMTQKMLKEEYCKAVDDFAETVKNLIVDLSVIRFKDIDEIAEQLKVGDGEWQSRKQ